MTTVYHFQAAFTKSGEGYSPSPAPTVTVIDDANNVLVNAQAVTMLSNMPGVAIYAYIGADNLRLIARFRTTDSTVDAKDLYSYTPPATYNADVAVSTRLASSSYTPPPTVGDIASAVWAASARTLTGFGTLVSDVWTYATRTLTGLGALAADVWAHPTRTLTSSINDTIDAMAGIDITVIRHIGYSKTIDNINYPANWKRLIMTAKRHPAEPDNYAILQLVVSNPPNTEYDGAKIVNGQAATNLRTHCAIVTDNDTLTINLDDVLTSFIDTGVGSYDFKFLIDGAPSVKPFSSAQFKVIDTETHAI
jgi:hypothetical protein